MSGTIKFNNIYTDYSETKTNFIKKRDIIIKFAFDITKKDRLIKVENSK